MPDYRALILALLAVPALAQAAAPAELLEEYRRQGAGGFAPTSGKAAWNRAGINGRSCATCHGEDLSQAGSHARTGKLIEPLAPSANPQRLADPRKVEKWLKRNCKWTWGRECSPQEKGDFLTWISSL